MFDGDWRTESFYGSIHCLGGNRQSPLLLTALRFYSLRDSSSHWCDAL
jgi:hypothetical protein